MKNLIHALVLLLASFYLAKSQAYSGPESVEMDYANNRWLIANHNNGTVIARDMNGNFSAFASGVTNGPYGIEILGNTLYCCNGTGLKGFDLTTGANTFNLSMGANFLNGICSDGVNNLYVTDFNAKKIYRVNVTNSTFNVFVTGLTKSPNGIIYEAANSRLVFVNWGTNAPINKVNLSDSLVSTLANTTLTNIDGIAADAYGNYYVSTWGNNSVRKYSSNFTVGPTTVITGLSSPADMFYNTVTDTLAIPNSGTANNVIWLGFGTLNVNANELAKGETEIFPQPNNGEFNIKTNAGKITAIKVYDITGKLVYAEKINFLSQYKIEMQLENGVYFAEILRDRITETKKIVVQH